MKENKTQATDASVAEFLATLDPSQRTDSEQLINIMQAISGEPPVLWGSSIIGFGTIRYTYASGRQGNWFSIGFSPRKGTLSLYLTCDVALLAQELAHIGKHRTGKGCIYIKTLTATNLSALRTLLQAAYNQAKAST